MGYILVQNVGNVNSGKTEITEGGNTLDHAKMRAKRIAKDTERGVRIYKDVGLLHNDGEYHSSNKRK